MAVATLSRFLSVGKFMLNQQSQSCTKLVSMKSAINLNDHRILIKEQYTGGRTLLYWFRPPKPLITEAPSLISGMVIS